MGFVCLVGCEFDLFSVLIEICWCRKGPNFLFSLFQSISLSSVFLLVIASSFH